MTVTGIAITPESWREPDAVFRARLGMWVFLASEILFFGGIFLAYAVVRSRNPAAFDAAGPHTDLFYGTLNTLLLMTSSFAAAIAVAAATQQDDAALRPALLAALLLGVAFLGVKGLEYHKDITEHLWPGRNFSLHPPAARSFFAFYWVMTGLHAVHVTAGLGVLGRVYLLARRARKPAGFSAIVEASILYWHLVDAIWVMLYPILYLVGRAL